MTVMETPVPIDLAPESEPSPEVDSLATGSPEPILEEPIPSIADGTVRSLDPRAVRLQRIVGGIVTASIAFPTLIAILLLVFLAPLPGWAKLLMTLGWPAVIGAVGWLGYRLPAIHHRHAAYKVDGHGIEIRGGVLWRTVTNVPRSRVQHTDVSQGPLERSHGLGTLVIYTAGTEHARVALAGLEHGTALLIRDHLLPKEDGDADAV